jgi:outer membrane protein assembly factor BamB
MRRTALGLVVLAATSVTALAIGAPHRPASLPYPIPGYLLIADRGNNRMLLVDSHKHILWRYPRAGQGTSFPFRFGDDTFFGPGLRTIISNQEDQDTIQIVSFPGGRVLWYYGHINQKGSSPGFLDTPDDAYLLPNGLVSVADAYNCRILFINHAHRIVRQIGQTTVCSHDPPRTIGQVNGATPTPDGGVLVSEINGSWVDKFSKTGRLIWSVRAPVSYPSDPQWLGDGKILIADYARPGHVLIMTTHGRVLWRYGPTSGPGALDHPSLALRLRSGLIAVNDDFRHRVVLISIPRRKIIWQYGHTDVKGTADGYLNTPDGMDLLPYRKALTTPALRRLLQTQPGG